MLLSTGGVDAGDDADGDLFSSLQSLDADDLGLEFQRLLESTGLEAVAASRRYTRRCSLWGALRRPCCLCCCAMCLVCSFAWSRHSCVLNCLEVSLGGIGVRVSHACRYCWL